jgi:DNA-binding GntR family transcriptional regulator
MSPGNTMMRVYAELSTRVVTGDFAPGERLDPMRLAIEHSASATPVRDALHRLTGERLLETFHQEGFRIPIVTETTLRSLYSWGIELIALIGKASQHGSNAMGADDVDARDVDFGVILVSLSTQSSNYEHRAAISNFVQRTARFRFAEFAVIDDAPSVSAISRAFREGERALVRSGMTDFYRRRLRHVPEIAALLRPREAD